MDYHCFAALLLMKQTSACCQEQQTRAARPLGNVSTLGARKKIGPLREITLLPASLRVFLRGLQEKSRFFGVSSVVPTSLSAMISLCARQNLDSLEHGAKKLCSGT